MSACRSNRHVCRADLGFTLVELQVALLLMSMIAVLLAGALRANVQAWTKSTQHQDTSEHRYLVGQFLRRHMEGMRFERVRDPEQRIMISFVGNNMSIHYLAPHPAVGSKADLYLWSLENNWNENEDKEQLTLKFVPYTSEEPIEFLRDGGMKVDDSEPTELVVSDKFLIEGFRYYSKGSQDIEKWHDELEAGSEAPEIIEITLKEASSERSSPRITELAISPRLYQQELASMRDT